MGKTRIGRKFIWLATGAVLIGAPLAPPGTFSFKGSPDHTPDAASSAHRAGSPVQHKIPFGPSERQSTPPKVGGAVDGSPNSVMQPASTDAPALNETPPGLAAEISEDGAELVDADEADSAAPEVWSREIASGDTLDVVLAEAGISANQRHEIATAISKKFKLSRLRPGNEVRVIKDPSGSATKVVIWMDENNSIQASIAESVEVAIIEPELSSVVTAREITIKGSIFTSLSNGDVPTRFASSLANALSGHIDFRRDLQAGDTLEVLWSEDRTEDGDRVGGSDISYARLNARGKTYDVVWEDSGAPLIFLDGDVIRTFSSPVPGARISSNYGMRRHPVLGGRRMHEGTDFAAKTGTPVLASTAGVVSYVGRRGGYGRVVEVKHSPSVKTRYAHLSRYNVKKGQRVEAGQRIGSVGSSGRVTGPHLHYEFLVNGRAKDPMASGRWKSLEADGSQREKLAILKKARKTFEDKKAGEDATTIASNSHISERTTPSEEP